MAKILKRDRYNVLFDALCKRWGYMSMVSCLDLKSGVLSDSENLYSMQCCPLVDTLLIVKF